MSRHRLGKLLGPGTVVSFLLAAAVIGYSAKAQVPTTQRTSHLPAPDRPLVKHEPGDLLANPELRLTEGQRKSIDTINQEWQGTKSDLLAAMSGYQPERGRVDQVSRSLEGYAQLSRQYDASRQEAWSVALSVLDETQRGKVRP